MARLRVATFNCQWRASRSSDARVIRERLFAPGLDVACLTETQSDFLDPNGYSVASAPVSEESRVAERRKVLLWSRTPWTSIDALGAEGMPGGRYAAATTDTPSGKVRLIGVVIPYRFAGVRFGQPRRTLWELHLAYLRALDRALPERPERTIILGDFNQRLPRKYQPRHVFDELARTVLSRFEMPTAGELQPAGRQAIDHIGHSADFACLQVRSLSNERPGGGLISDHFGAWAELEIAR